MDAQGRIFFVHGPQVFVVGTNGTAVRIVHDARGDRFTQLHHIQRSPDGRMVTASDYGDGLWAFSASGELTRYHPPANTDRMLRVGLGGDPFAVTPDGSVVSVNAVQGKFSQILRTDPEGRITTVAGGEWGHRDGPAGRARFGDPHGGSMLALSDGSILLTEDHARVRRIAADGSVSTLAGGAVRGHVDGPRKSSRLDGAAGLAMDRSGNILVVERAGRVRRITPAGRVSTIAGGGARPGADGPAQSAGFVEPTGIAVDRDGSLLVLEPGVPRIRRISGERVSTVLPGLP